jgi:hypothetical protein
MFAPLLQHLGISREGINHEGISRESVKVKNADLFQGKEYLTYNDKLAPQVFKRLKFLQVSSIPGLLSINEAMHDSDSVNKHDTKLLTNEHITADIVKNENAFNKSLSEYGSLQQNLANSNLYHNVDASVTATILDKLAALNTQLLQHAHRINADMSNLHVSDAELQNHIATQQAHVNQYIQTLGEQGTVLNGMGEHASLDRTTNYYHYLLWLIVLVTVCAFGLYILTSDVVLKTLLLIICVMVIYLLSTLF